MTGQYEFYKRDTIKEKEQTHSTDTMLAMLMCLHNIE